MLSGTISELFTYPIKGLSRQPLSKVTLEAGKGFPADRICGLARHDSGFDPENPQPLAKHHFLMLMRDEQLARLSTQYDPETGRLQIEDAGDVVLDVDTSQQGGRRGAEEFFRLLLDLPEAEAPSFVSADPHRFTDVSVVSPALMNAVSLINLASVAAFGDHLGQTVDPARFRGNIHFDGWPPFAELDLVGETLQIGSARAKVTLRTKRCPATEVNPRTAQRDIRLPQELHKAYGHRDMGIYAEIIEPGEIRAGDTIRVGA